MAATTATIDAIPRVNGAALAQFVGSNVRLVGEVQNATGPSVSIKAADGLPVTIQAQDVRQTL